MSTIREMLVELTGMPEFANSISDDTDLGASGVESGDLVRLLLLIEQRTKVTFTAEDLDGLSTIADYERFLAAHGGAGQPLSGAQCG